ncbi:3-ketoacyl-CoA thiolase with broad chain length specificity [Saitoella coloradoensis]
MASAVNRVAQVASHITGLSSTIDSKNQDDVVVVSALRSALTKGGKGGFKDTQASDILAGVLKATITKSGINPSLVQDIAVGSVLPPGGGATEFRAAALVAGFPSSTSVNAVNRQCSSGLQACVQIAHEIKAGMIDCGIGAGVESMSNNYGPGAVSEFSDLLKGHPEAKDCLIPMGITSENVAKEFNISRQAQDEFAASSYAKAAKAQQQGLFNEEIVPLKVKFTDPKTDEEKEVTVDRDDGVRPGVTAESLAKIKPAFSKTGSTHAGNASQISDGAAAVLLCRRSFAQANGLQVIGKFISASVAGVPPRVMGIGPAYAIPIALEKAGITKDQVDIYEINEAFASQALYSCQVLGLPLEKVNPKGGAIAFGHPLGATGARQISTLLTELKRTGKKVGVTSMCIGTGMGMASVWVAE